jgi:hypothetical protein
MAEGAAAAERLGGTASVAIWVDGWERPVVVGDAPAAGRLWSMSKAVAAVALFEAEERRGRSPGRVLETALTDAITRSDNCGERRVVIGLQELTGGLPEADGAFHEVLAAADVRIGPTPQEDTLAPDTCQVYFEQRAATSEPDAVALEFGTDTWTVADAVRFAHALTNGTYGQAGAAVLSIMRKPKAAALTALEGNDGDHIPDLEWGAGDVFAGSQPAYKSGWGGSQQHRFLAGQIVVLAGARPRVAIAAVFYPSPEPTDDDVGATAAPEAIARLLTPIAGRLRRDRVIR